MSKSILKIIYSCFVQKTAPKKLNIREMRTFLKSANMHAKALAHAKSSLWLKNKNSKNMSKSIPQIIYSCSVQKAAPKTPDNREMRGF